MARSNRLTLVRATRVVEEDLSDRKESWEFLDFVIDGEPLYERVHAAGIDNITPIWLERTATPESAAAIRRLLGDEPADAPGGRVSVYVCAECGDLGCGAVTVDVTIGETVVTWSDWGFQNNYEPEIQRDLVPRFGTLTFAREEYEAVLRDALTDIEGLGR